MALKLIDKANKDKVLWEGDETKTHEAVEVGRAAAKAAKGSGKGCNLELHQDGKLYSHWRVRPAGPTDLREEHPGTVEKVVGEGAAAK